MFPPKGENPSFLGCPQATAAGGRFYRPLALLWSVREGRSRPPQAPCELRQPMGESRALPLFLIRLLP